MNGDGEGVFGGGLGKLHPCTRRRAGCGGGCNALVVAEQGLGDFSGIVGSYASRVGVSNSLFVGNVAAQGALFVTGGTEADVSDCVFSANVAHLSGSSLYAETVLELTLLSSSFSDGVSLGSGGGCVALDSIPSALIRGSDFTRCVAGGPRRG